MLLRHAIRCAWAQLVSVALLISLVTTAQAEPVSLAIPGGVTAQADYRKGESDKPAVLVLHGFLQTHKFSTVQRIVDELVDNGFTALAPTLTLKIDHRKNSLTCDAIQSHTPSNAMHEIDQWFQWLKAKGHSSIVLLGHSTGSIQLLTYINSKEDASVIRFIATSIGPIWDPDISPGEVKRARALLSTSPNKIDKYHISFCRGNYAAPPAAFLAYAEWTEDYIMENLGRLKIPSKIILGGSDDFLPPNWTETLGGKSTDITIINGANHFFTGEGEFDFLDSVIASVTLDGE